MFERFTERARLLVVSAQDEARSLGHGRIGTEHLLLGLLRDEEGLAARALDSLGVRLGEARAQVARLAPPAEPAATGQIPFSPRAKKALELSLREALALGHGWIGTEHVLLALGRVGDGAAARVLAEVGAPPERVRRRVLELLGGEAARPGPRGPSRFRRGRRYAHRVLVLGSAEELTDELLAPLGADGWRVAAVVPAGAGLRVVLERPAPPASG